MKNVRYAMAKGKKGKKHTHHDRHTMQTSQLTDRPMKSDLPQMLRGDTWPGQKTHMGNETMIGRK